MSDARDDDYSDIVELAVKRGLAEDHVDWFLNMIRPLLISYFEHGYKHGKEEASDE